MALAEQKTSEVFSGKDLRGLFSPFLGGLDADSYVALLRDVLVGPHDPAHVVLMEMLR
jgi:hypothetical protein